MSTDNPTINHAITLNEHNFIVQTLNRNPLGAPVMEVAALISKLNATATAALAPPPAPPETPANPDA